MSFTTERVSTAQAVGAGSSGRHGCAPATLAVHGLPVPGQAAEPVPGVGLAELVDPQVGGHGAGARNGMR